MAASLIVEVHAYEEGHITFTIPERYRHITCSMIRRDHNYETLCSQLEELQSITTKLLQNEIITREELDRINVQHKRRRKVGELLEILFSRESDRWVDDLIKILLECDQAHVLNKIKKLAEPQVPRRIRRFNRAQFQQRVVLQEEELEDAIIRSYNADKLKTARETMNCDIITLYKGSLCFLLDPLTMNAIEDLWNRKINFAKIKKFLSSILNEYEFKKVVTDKRVIHVEITERPNEFLFHIEGNSVNMVNKNRLTCSAIPAQETTRSTCYRQTVIDNYENILDEIETSMMAETFVGKHIQIPGCIRRACIDEKDERTREERADIFLQFILTNEELLIKFNTVFSIKSDVQIANTQCEAHGGDKLEPANIRESVVLKFEMYYDRKSDAIIVTPLTEQLNPTSSIFNDLKLSHKRLCGTQAWISIGNIRKLKASRCSLSDYKKKSIKLLNERPTEKQAKNEIMNESYQRLRMMYPVDTIEEEGFFSFNDKNDDFDEVRMISNDSDELRIVLIGNTRSSRLENILLNDPMLNWNDNNVKVKRGCFFDNQFRKKIVVVCTSATSFEGPNTYSINDEITQCIAVLSPGPHAFILSMHADDLFETTEHEEMIETTKKLFGSDVLSFIIIAVDGIIRASDEIIKTLVKDSPNIQNIFKNERIIYLTRSRMQIVTSLLQFVERRPNSQRHFSNQMFKRTEDIITRKISVLTGTIQEEYRRHEKAIAQLKASILPHRIRQKKITDLNMREVVIQTFTKSIDDDDFYHNLGEI